MSSIHVPTGTIHDGSAAIHGFAAIHPPHPPPLTLRHLLLKGEGKDRRLLLEEKLSAKQTDEVSSGTCRCFPVYLSFCFFFLCPARTIATSSSKNVKSSRTASTINQPYRIALRYPVRIVRNAEAVMFSRST